MRRFLPSPERLFLIGLALTGPWIAGVVLSSPVQELPPDVEFIIPAPEQIDPEKEMLRRLDRVTEEIRAVTDRPSVGGVVYVTGKGAQQEIAFIYDPTGLSRTGHVVPLPPWPEKTWDTIGKCADRCDDICRDAHPESRAREASVHEDRACQARCGGHPSAHCYVLRGLSAGPSH